MSGCCEGTETCLLTIESNNQNRVSYNLKWKLKKKKNKGETGKDNKSKRLQQQSGNKWNIIAGMQSQDSVQLCYSSTPIASGEISSVCYFSESIKKHIEKPTAQRKHSHDYSQ